jgi:TolB-like protein
MLVGTAGVFVYVVPTEAELDPNVVAVMACDNWTGDANLEYVTDGLAEDIMHAVYTIWRVADNKNQAISKVHLGSQAASQKPPT